MRFFEQKEIAKRNSRLLTFLFTINVIILSIINAFAVGTYFKFDNEQIVYVFITSTAIFVIATLISLLGGRTGTRIAEMLGGRGLQFPLKSSAEKRLYNVVEEMAIASGVPIPYVYVLEGDDSINAFAAGTDSKHIVVAVTKGALNKLTRDELQAVIGHEFSHILHEDMELNARTTGVVSGFYVFMRMGLWILRNSSGSRNRRGRGDATIAVFFAGIAFLIFGSIGYFLARLIQSMISKQREFLADASSAQYTRNPEALARALAKIGYHSGSEILSPNRLDVSHMFFAEAMSGTWTSLFSTHPKIEDRIKTLLPNVSFDKFVSSVKQEFIKLESEHFQNLVNESEDFERKVSERKNSFQSAVNNRQSTAEFIAAIANPAVGHFHYTDLSLRKIPTTIRNQIQDPNKAKIALFAVLLFTQEEELKTKFIAEVSNQNPDEMAFLNECINFCSAHLDLRLTFFKVVLGILRQGQAADNGHMMVIIKSFFLQDKKFTLVESLYYIVCDNVLGQEPKRTSSINDIRSVSKEVFRLLLSCEFSSEAKSEDIKAYFKKIRLQFPLFTDVNFILPDQFKFDFLQFRNDLVKLSQLSLNLKQKLILIFYENYKADQVLNQQEVEVLSLILLYLKIPVPPMIEKELKVS